MMRERHGANYLLLILGAFSILLLSLPLTGRVQAFRAYVSYLVDPFPYYGSQGVMRLASLPVDAARLIGHDIELQRLQRESREMALVRAELHSAFQENARLRLALGMKPAGGHVIRWARIMERDPLHWFRSVLVDVGASDGIQINAPVLGLRDDRLGVVGRVIEVGPRTAKVLLLTDETSAVAAQLPINDWEGLTQGQGSSRLRMNYLPIEAAVQVGEAVYTSATSETFPPDLLIGTVSRVFERDPFLTFQAVEVAPAVPVGSLKEVMILAPRRLEDEP